MDGSKGKEKVGVGILLDWIKNYLIKWIFSKFYLLRESRRIIEENL